MAKIGKLKQKKVMIVSHESLLLDIENGLADSLEDAKENNTKTLKKIYGKETIVQFS